MGQLSDLTGVPLGQPSGGVPGDSRPSSAGPRVLAAQTWPAGRWEASPWRAAGPRSRAHIMVSMPWLTSLGLGWSLSHCVHTLPWESLLGEDWVPCRPGPSSAAVPVTERKRNTALPTPVGGTPAQPPGLSPLCGLSPPLILSQQRANPSCFPVPHLSQPCAHSPRKHRLMG